MTTIRKIVTSKIDGNDANSTNDSEIRPFGETAFYLDTNWPSDKPTLMIFDGVRTHRESKVLAPGILWGSSGDSGDGSGADTIKLIPDAEIFANGSNQFIVIDPTQPNHIHIRAGGTVDNSSAELYLGGENSHIQVGSGENPPIFVKANNNTWIFDVDANLRLPAGGDILDGNGVSVLGGGNETLDTVTDRGATTTNSITVGGVITTDVTGKLSAAVGARITGIRPPEGAGSNNGYIWIPEITEVSSYGDITGWTLTNSDGVFSTTVTQMRYDLGTPWGIQTADSLLFSGTYTFTSPDYAAPEPLPLDINVDTNTWIFGTDGKLTLPGNITATIDQSIQLESKSNVTTPGQEITAADNQGLGSSDFITVWIEGSGGTDYPEIVAVQPGWTVSGPGLTNDIVTNVETIVYAPGMSVYKITTTTTSDKDGYSYIFTEPATTSLETNTWIFGTTGRLEYPDGTRTSGAGLTIPVESTYELSLSRYPTASGLADISSDTDNLFVDITEVDDIITVQAGWQINSGSPSAPIWVDVTEVSTPSPGVYRIIVPGFGFTPGTVYTFRNPTPAESTWVFDEFGNFITPGSGSISHRNNDLTLEVNGTDVIVLRTGGGELVLDANGDLSTPNQVTLGGQTYTNNAIIWQNGSGAVINNNAIDEYFIIATNYNTGTQQNWKFGYNGVLTLPGEGVIRSNDDTLVLQSYDTTFNVGKGIRIGSNGHVYFELGDDPAYFQIEEADGDAQLVARTNLTIMANGGSTIKQWNFNTDGTVTLPRGGKIEDTTDGVISTTNFVGAPGSRVTIQQRIDESTFGSSIQFDNEGDIALVAQAGLVNKTWTFNTDGSVTFPDSSVQTSAWTKRIVAVPASSTGTAGDLEGDLAFNSTHMYYCTQDFGGTVINMTSISSSGASNPYVIMYDSNTGWTSADLTGYTVTGPSGYTGTVTGPSVNVAGQLWHIPVSPNLSQSMGTYTFTSPGGNIWKRIAWSGDTW